MTTLTAFSSAANDGNVEAVSTVYATATTTPTTVDSASSIQYLGQQFFTPNYQLDEIFLEFGTTSVPFDATVQSAVLSIFVQADGSATDFTIEARPYDYGVALDGSGVDWRTPAQLAALTLAASVSTAGISTSAYTDLTENGTNLRTSVVKDGVNPTRYVLDSSRLVSQTAPTGFENVQMYMGDAAGTTNDPKLVVTYVTTVPRTVGATVGISTAALAEVAFGGVTS